MRQLLFYLIPIFLIAGCTGDKNKFVVKGTIENSNGEKLVLLKLTTQQILPVDSAVVDIQGRFEISDKIENPGFYILRDEYKRHINLIIYPGDKIEITTNIDNFESDYYIEGSHHSRLVKDLISKQNRVLEQISAISNEYEKSKNDPQTFLESKSRLDSLYNKITLDHKNYSIDFIKKNPRSLASLMALYQQLGVHVSLFDPIKDFEIFNYVDSNLMMLYPGLEAVKSLNQTVVEASEEIKFRQIEEKKLGIGRSAPEISLPDTKELLVSLSSFKGKYVLVDFWASWCNPCRNENPNLVRLYRKYNSRGFEIYQVSLDQSKEPWVSAIEDDQLNWTQVSDLKYWNSVVVPLYNLNGIPANYLLDKDGIIIAKDLFGHELEQKLKEIFNY